MGGLPIRLLKGFGALVLAVLAGCGGRSSTLEPESVSDQSGAPGPGPSDSGGGGAAAHGNAGASGPIAGGNTGTPTGGASTGGASGIPAGGASEGGSAGDFSGGTWGVGGSAAPGHAAPGRGSGGSAGTAPGFNEFPGCTEYCSVVTQGVCPDAGSFEDCRASCANEVTSRNPQCQQTAELLLNCLVTAYQNSRSCADVDQLSAAKCSALAAAYQPCVGTDPVPVPNPRPVPTPARTCASSGSSDNGACSVAVKCSDGAYYTIACTQSSSAQSNCSCDSRLPDGSGTGTSFGLNESVTFACYDSLAACGFPQNGLK